MSNLSPHTNLTESRLGGIQPVAPNSAPWNDVLAHTGGPVTVTRYTWHNERWQPVDPTVDSAAVIRGVLAYALKPDGDHHYARIRVITGYNSDMQPSGPTFPYSAAFAVYSGGDSDGITREAYGITLEKRSAFSRLVTSCVGRVALGLKRLRRQKA
jgi:hypothetical protein